SPFPRAYSFRSRPVPELKPATGNRCVRASSEASSAHLFTVFVPSAKPMQESIPRYARNYSSYQYTPDNASRALTLRLSCNPVSMLRRQSCQVPALALRVPLFPHPVEIGMKDIQLCDSALLCFSVPSSCCVSPLPVGQR